MGRIYERDGRYGIDYTNHRGKRVRKVVASDKSIAMKLLGDAMRAAEGMKAGLLEVDPRDTKRPIKEHFDAYERELHARGRDAMYVYIVKKRLEAVAFAQEWSSLRDCTVKSIAAYLHDLGEDGKSARTVNGHRADLAAFFAWCVRTGYLEGNPCERVSKVTIKADKTRRALSVAECESLIAAAPADRALCYRTLLFTGLRRAEAAQLLWDHIHLEVANPYIELPASITKSGKPETVPLVPELASELRNARGENREAVFAAIPTMAQFRLDLAAAKIDESDVRGRKVVLHSLRHSLATMLAQSKVPPAVAMKIMRHRDIRLTLEAYTDESLLPVTAAMATLPRIATACALSAFN